MMMVTQQLTATMLTQRTAGGLLPVPMAEVSPWTVHWEPYIILTQGTVTYMKMVDSVNTTDMWRQLLINY